MNNRLQRHGRYGVSTREISGRQTTRIRCAVKHHRSRVLVDRAVAYREGCPKTTKIATQNDHFRSGGPFARVNAPSPSGEGGRARVRLLVELVHRLPE